MEPKKVKELHWNIQVLSRILVDPCWLGPIDSGLLGVLSLGVSHI